MRDSMKHLIASLVFVAALILMLDPFRLWMPSFLEMAVSAVVAVIAAIFIGLVITDKGRDEREVAERGASARMGYIAGVLVLSLCVVFSALSHEPASLWVLGALAAMILVRVIHRGM